MRDRAFKCILRSESAVEGHHLVGPLPQILRTVPSFIYGPSSVPTHRIRKVLFTLGTGGELLCYHLYDAYYLNTQTCKKGCLFIEL